ncbi:hypothetical protein J7F03_17280 [Streptomyces sp. ISL-43]|uniref:hypothetical protein n=1 Tax=Streptomyces sp. ISL-43 TaxID=2819183 RepID=UPI001BEA1B8B|nr:hypothetical protein [Streptomyces sp. ISL-43]MBT2448812.1 hypothetical protein [Streptomyces sp. ISL-43]
MTLQSDRAGQAEQSEPTTPRTAAGPGGDADRIREVVRDADPGAAWAVGGPDGPDGPDAVVEAGADAGADGDGDVDAGDRAGVLDVGGLAGVLAVWPVIGILVDAGELQLHTPLTAYGAGGELPDGTTAHQLLTHGSGPSPALVGLAERLCGGPLAGFAADRVWGPLGMTRTRFAADGTLRAPVADLARFLSHLLAPAGGPVSPAWTAQSLRIRTGELTPARGLLWHPAPHGAWSHGEGPALWVSPRGQRWAALLPTTPSAPLRTAFRDAVFG